MITLNTLIVILVILGLLFFTIIGEEHNKLKDKFSVEECLVEVLIIFVSIVLLCFKSDLIAIYLFKDMKFYSSIGLFHTDSLITYRWWIFIVYMIGLLFTLMKMWKGKWTKMIVILHLLYRVFSFCLLSSMILNRSLYNPLFFEQLFIYNPPINLDILCYMMIGIIGVTTLLDIIKSFLKLTE